MRYLLALAAAFLLMMGGAVAQQYPQTPVQQQYPQTPVQQQYPQAPVDQQQYPQASGQQPYSAMTIPAGSQIQIRTNDQITANKSSEGRQYSGEIAQDVMGQNGQVLIPQGSPATLTVGQISNGTLGVQSNEVALGLQSVTVNGRTYTVSANNVQQTTNNQRGIGANKRTAEMTGGGAALGTLVGAIAGGGKGALLGALIGGGGGAAAQVLTRGSNVNVPAETLLTFKLDQPLTLQ